MAKARSASVTQSKLMTVIYGNQFTGKSTMAMQLAYFKRPDGKPFKVLYLDPESGSIDDYLGDLEESGVNLGNIYIVYTQSLGEVRQYIAKVKNNEDLYELDEDGNETDDVVLDADGEPFRADAIVVDGTTILNLTVKQSLVEFSKKRNKVKADKDGLIGDAKLVKIEGAGMELKDYQTVNFKGQDLILDLMASGVHCVVTAREADEKEQIKLPNGETTSVNTGRKMPDGFKGMGYNAKTVIHMFADKETGICAEIDKDRTGVHKQFEIIEDPTLLDWQAVIDKTANKSSFVIKNDLTKAVDIDQNIYRKEILGDEADSSADTSGSSSDSKSSSETADSVRAEINAFIKSLSVTEKPKVKQQLESKGLPTAFKTITNIEVLKEVLKALSTIKE